MMIDLKKAVKGNVEFQYFRDGALWYATEEGEVFPVPVEDAASSTFNRVEKGMMLMRWMRKWNDGSGEGEIQ
jgi:hypothetical protein